MKSFFNIIFASPAVKFYAKIEWMKTVTKDFLSLRIFLKPWKEFLNFSFRDQLHFKKVKNIFLKCSSGYTVTTTSIKCGHRILHVWHNNLGLLRVLIFGHQLHHVLITRLFCKAQYTKRSDLNKMKMLNEFYAF